MDIIGIAGLIVSIIAIVAAIVFNYHQIEHNKNSVRPYIDFMFNQSDGLLFVKVRNAGFGPLIVKSVTITFKGKSKNSVLSCFSLGGNDRMEQAKKYYSLDGGRLVEGKVLSPNTEFPLLWLKIRDDIEFEKDAEYYRIIATVLETLRNICIRISYTDVYDRVYDEEMRDFKDCFGMRYQEYLTNKNDPILNTNEK
jgi:hypothetical protein